MKTSILRTRIVGYSFQKTAILKLSKPAVCPLHAIATQSRKAKEFIIYFNIFTLSRLLQDLQIGL